MTKIKRYDIIIMKLKTKVVKSTEYGGISMVNNDIVTSILNDYYYLDLIDERVIERFKDILSFEDRNGYNGIDIFKCLENVYINTSKLNYECTEDSIKRLKLKILSDLENWYILNNKNLRNKDDIEYMFRFITLKDNIYFYSEIYEYVNYIIDKNKNVKIYNVYSFVNRFLNELEKEKYNNMLTIHNVYSIINICLVHLKFNESLFFEELEHFCTYKDNKTGIQVFMEILINTDVDESEEELYKNVYDIMMSDWYGYKKINY